VEISESEAADAICQIALMAILCDWGCKFGSEGATFNVGKLGRKKEQKPHATLISSKV